MRCIADAQKSRPRPLSQAIHLHREKTYVLPVRQFSHAVVQKWLQAGDLFAKPFDASLANLIRGAFWNDKATLPIVLAVNHDQHFAGFDMPKTLARIAGPSTDPHPQD